MKTKVIFLNVLMFILSNISGYSQTIAVAPLSTHGINLTPEIAAKLTRIELVKLEKYNVLDAYDMEAALEGKGNFNDCYGRTCLTDMGKALEVEQIISGSIDKFGPKIIISLKMINVNTGELSNTKTMEFDDQPAEISRMMQITLQEMLSLPVDAEDKKRLAFNNELITSNNVGKINNSGPRFGISYVATGELNSFFMRDKRLGGLESVPVMSNLGYQFEMQYVGTENFSALFEIIPNIGGLEQGNFIPTLSLLNGFRFGKSGWEFAFGPSFGARKMLSGIQTDNGFVDKNTYLNNDYNNWLNDPNNFDEWGYPINPYVQPNESWTKQLDTRGNLEFNTNWLMAFGRTFRAGALNIPVNIYYSGNKYGGVIGTSVGFNIIKSKEPINTRYR
ncbi:hypothetical protein K6119_06155 [Paracrocinitomix mangrovi]|uniref:hypothetical protein n=1 Tax=Paracrocinitomix mangrovi TaxID=2862509 RepID=UPI001C8E5AA6|nr:hypothetical protein [Paracrocinitomix mangrovi]UKN03094.1 hypothetical protein K6119_06155 [Paracrocinitomix mangrovi]